MKKFYLVTLAALLCGFFLSFSTVQAGDNSVLDQSYAVESNSGYGSVGIGGHGQTFVPTKNRITSIDVYFKNRQTGTSITMTVKNFQTQQVIGTETHTLTFAGDAAWEPFVFDQNLVVVPGTTYAMYLSSNIDNPTYWMTGNDGVPYSRGVALTGTDQLPVGEDRLFRQYGKDVTTPATPPATTTTTTAAKTTTATPVAAPTVLAVPKNFRIDRDLGTEIIFAWDKNTEADLSGYALFIYDGETEAEIIDLPNKDSDNYNVILADHSALVKGKEYSFKLVAKNSAGAISGKTDALEATFKDTKVEVKVAEAQKSWIENPWVLGGAGFTLVILIGLLIFLERKYHGLAAIFKKKDKTEN
jgi:hypothetical protein